MRNSCLNLNHPFRKTSAGKNGLSHIEPASSIQNGGIETFCPLGHILV